MYSQMEVHTNSLQQKSINWDMSKELIVSTFQVSSLDLE